ncbi:MAG: hypothetical protein MUE72_04865 [Chitinophagaceae bacterium]|jgi:hypothetical protein|nr:hypothetical protein [Chitinophagaceae bacterium]
MENNFKIIFKSRPIPIFPSYRPMYRIAQVLLVLKINSVGGKASLLKLHLFSWAFKSYDNLTLLKNFVLSNFQNKLLYFGIEPSLNRALNLAIGEGLISFDSAKYSITEKGENFVAEILKDKEIFLSERIVLDAIGKKLTEKEILKLEKLWKNA